MRVALLALLAFGLVGCAKPIMGHCESGFSLNFDYQHGGELDVTTTQESGWPPQLRTDSVTRGEHAFRAGVLIHWQRLPAGTKRCFPKTAPSER